MPPKEKLIVEQPCLLSNDLDVIKELKEKKGIHLTETTWDEDRYYIDEENAYIIENGHIVLLKINALRMYIIDDEVFEIITKLEHLEDLSLTEGIITKFPENIENLKNLKHLNLWWNDIKLFSNKLLLPPLVNLESLNLDVNPILDNIIAEAEVFSPQELILFLSIQNKKQLNEAKILILGDEDVGKTSIVNRIVNNKFEITKNMTEGIDIQSYTLSNDIKMNIWDFAGQEITHQTHQFFLTKRSLYFLVLDAQKEDNDSAIYNWLQVIKSSAKDSHIIIIINKIDKNEAYHFDINRYKQKFPSIWKVIYVSAKEDKNISQLVETIEQISEKIENVKGFFPETWFRVKEELELLSSNENFIEGGDFEKICEKHDIDKEKEQHLLLKMLNEIGTVVHYKNKSLHHVQILNPLWITNAVYKVIRSEFLNKDAVLKQEYLYEIFKEDKRYKQRHYPWIMDLLVQFEVAFRVDENKILIPSRLRNIQPKIELEKFKKLNFRYKYEGRLKKGIIAQFMVKMVRYFSDKQEIPYWKDGIRLNRSNCEAVVISHSERKEITIYIDTDNPQGREFLAIIRDTFDEINKNSNVVEEIPLIVKNKIVGYTKYNYLIALEKKGRKEIDLEVDTEDFIHTFQISSLLDGYSKNHKKTFDYDMLLENLVRISKQLLKDSNIFEKENPINDKFKGSLELLSYNVAGEDRVNVHNERDLIIKDSHQSEKTIIEALRITYISKKYIEEHYSKLIGRYDPMGHPIVYLLIYTKNNNFESFWDKYVKYLSGFTNFCKTEISDVANIKVGQNFLRNKTVYHICINFSS